MLVRTGLPKTLLWVINLLAIFLLLFTFLRLAMVVAFFPDGEQLSDLIPALLLGGRYDLRWIGIMLLPIVLISLYPSASPFYSQVNRKWWTWYLAIVTFVVVFFFAADFACFSYNRTRLNASALNFAEDPVTSAKMLWESYPIIWLVGALFVCVLILRWMFRQTHGYVISKTDGLGIPYRRRSFIVAAVILSFFIYGSFSLQPLKWNRAFAFGDSFRSYVALNPLQNFATTLKFRKPAFDNDKAITYFPVMKDLMKLDTQGFSFARTSLAPRIAERKPNVVLVLCESFSMYKSSLSGNPLNTTPYFRSMADSGVLFERCFSPHFSTARGLFATVTGIPDVQLSKFSTRNPEAVNQKTIINDFKGYNKYYFLGGNAAFNNFEGLMNNVEGIRMMTEGKFRSKPVSVWGISDKDLFLEANRVFASEEKPFFAVVQTADNHRPFAIPESEKDFKKKVVPPDTLRKYGFESLNEYNSFRYADYCIEVFMNAARKESYFENTLFVFIGDHGVSGNATSIYGETWTRERLTEEHIPLLFYAPAFLKAEKRKDVVSQIDVLPTIASITGHKYTNTTLGRDVIKKRNGKNFAFIIHHDEGRIGMVTDEFYFTRNLNFKKEEINWFSSPTYTPAQQDSIKTKMSALTTAFYETAKWMLVNNRRTAGDSSNGVANAAK